MSSDDASDAVSVPKETTLSSADAVRKLRQRQVAQPELQPLPGEDGDEWEGFYEDGDGWKEL